MFISTAAFAVPTAVQRGLVLVSRLSGASPQRTPTLPFEETSTRPRCGTHSPSVELGIGEPLQGHMIRTQL